MPQLVALLFFFFFLLLLFFFVWCGHNKSYSRYPALRVVCIWDRNRGSRISVVYVLGLMRPSIAGNRNLRIMRIWLNFNRGPTNLWLMQYGSQIALRAMLVSSRGCITRKLDRVYCLSRVSFEFFNQIGRAFRRNEKVTETDKDESCSWYYQTLVGFWINPFLTKITKR